MSEAKHKTTGRGRRAVRTDARIPGLHPWEPGDYGKGFLLRPPEAGAPPRVLLWTDPHGTTVHHIDLSQAAGLSSGDILAYLRVEPAGQLEVYGSGELDGRTYIDWLLELDPRLSEGEWQFDFEQFGLSTSVEDASVELLVPVADTSARDALHGHLSDALGAALTLADRSSLPARLAERLSAAAGYVLQRDPELRRLGRTAAMNALAHFAATVRDGSPLHQGWASIVATHLRPAGTELLAEISAQGDLDSATLARLDGDLVESAYLGRSESELWQYCEALARLLAVRRALRVAPHQAEPLSEAGQRALTEVSERALTVLERLITRLNHAITEATGDGEAGARRPPAGCARIVATCQEALVDGLLNPASRALTAGVYASGSLADHVEAVRRHVGDPVAVPVVVLANDRWFREIHPDRLDPSGAHLRNQAIMLSRRVGERAAAERAQGRLSHTLVHELVHATQRDRRGPLRRPPYDARGFEVETKILEGLTEHFTQKVMRDARANWKGAGANPYSQREFRGSGYYGYSFVCLAGVRAAGGLPDTFLRELSHNPHKLTMYAELLTGRYTPERKAALVPVFEQLFALAEAWQAQRRRLESELPEVAEQAFRDYARSHAPTAADQAARRSG